MTLLGWALTSRMPMLGPSAPAVRFGGTRGPGSWAGSFLASSALLLPGNGSTHFAVFKDGGSVADCCSGVVYWGGSGVEDDMGHLLGKAPSS